MRRTRLITSVAQSLWFVPVLCVLLGAVLSFATIAIDRHFDYELVPTSSPAAPTRRWRSCRPSPPRWCR